MICLFRIFLKIRIYLKEWGGAGNMLGLPMGRERQVQLIIMNGEKPILISGAWCMGRIG